MNTPSGKIEADADENGYLTPISTFESLSPTFSQDSNKCFLDRLFDGSGHSPPRQNHCVPKMTKEEVEKRMQKLLFHPVSWLKKKIYLKVAWIVGTGLDEFLRAHLLGGRVLLPFLLNKNNRIGRRFHAIYNTEGDQTVSDDVITSFSHFVSKVNYAWGESNGDTCFTLFGSDDHGNMEVFRRFQAFGGCFIHAVLMLHWYKSLYDDPERLASDTEFHHVSTFIRHSFTPEALYKVIVQDGGGDPRDVAEELMGGTCQTIVLGRPRISKLTFEDIKSRLESWGPLIAMLQALPQNFYDYNILSHEGKVPNAQKTQDGHAMIVLGVRKQQDKVFLLLQNFWKQKEFLEMDLDYLQSSGGSLFGMDGTIDHTSLAHKDSRTTAGDIRMTICSSPLDRPVRVKLFK